MELILWRHADAFEGGTDLLRELTPKGHKQAKHMAAWLNARMPVGTRILVSPAVRAQQTADTVGRPFTTDTALAPDSDPMTLLLAAKWPESSDTVLLIGHQPALGRTAMLLLTGVESELNIKKSGIIWLNNRIRQETQQNTLRAALSPELI